MNTKTITGLLLVLLTVSACTTTAAPPSGNTAVTTLSKADRYQIAVQNQARFKGVDVHWVNPPDEGDLAKYDLSANSPEVTSRSN